MKTFSLSSIILLSCLAFAGCGQYEYYEVAQKPTQETGTDRTYNTFSFSTESNGVNVNLSYNLDVKTNIYFELFDEEPGEWADNGKYYKKDGVTPFFTGFTDSEGKFSGAIDMPSYVTKLYAYSPAFIAAPLMVANTGEISFHEPSSTKAEIGTRAPMDGVTNKSFMVCPISELSASDAAVYNDKRWKDWLVTYDNKGRVQNRFDGEPNLPLIPQETLDEYTKTHVAVFPNTNRSAYPWNYIRQADLELTQDAEVAVTFVGGNTCWNSSMGYYYYPVGQEPKSIDDVDVILLFPNTQNGGKTNNYDGTATMGTHNGDCVKLMYYPNIASGSQEGATYRFPAGYKVGLVLAVNAWSQKISDKWKTPKRQRSATTPIMSRDKNGNIPTAKYNNATVQIPMSAVYNINGQVLISFEDDLDWDKNYSDVIVTFQSNPLEAIAPTPEPSYEFIEATEYKGFYAFEDQWPSKGDYDMNDILFNSTYHKKYSTANSCIYEEGYVIKTFTNAAKKENLKTGIAVKLEGITNNDVLEFSIKKPGASTFSPAEFEYDSSIKVVYVTDNVKGEIGTEYKINVVHPEESTVLQTGNKVKAKPFVYRDQDGKRIEIHISGEAPTIRADTLFFGTEDDCSDRNSKVYYVRKGSYPFGFFLSGATENNMKKFFAAENESKVLGNVFSDYDSWVISNGTQKRDWYKR